MDVLAHWRIVREEAARRLAAEIASASGPSIWHAESMDAGDVSEFADMMANFERLIGVSEADRLNWGAVINEAEAAK